MNFSMIGVALGFVIKLMQQGEFSKVFIPLFGCGCLIWFDYNQQVVTGFPFGNSGTSCFRFFIIFTPLFRQVVSLMNPKTLRQ